MDGSSGWTASRPDPGTRCRQQGPSTPSMAPRWTTSELVGPMHLEARGHVREDRPPMIAVRGGDPAAAAFWLEVLLAQDAPDPLGVDARPAVAERGANAAVAVGRGGLARRALISVTTAASACVTAGSA